jgi:anti-sigma regulatory factor (Ser/Thr protein kinase)
VDSAAEAGTRRFQGTYSAEPAQVGHARRALAQALDGHPAADAATLIASELATNAVLHSASAHGGKFTLAVEIQAGYVWVGVGDGGGPWNRMPHRDGRAHGLDVVEAIAGSENWGVDGDTDGRVAWARINA